MSAIESYESEVKKVYVELFEIDVEPESIGSEEELFGPQCDYGIDSMDVLRFLADLRQRYDLDVSEIATETFRTPASIAVFLSERGGTAE
ncbi:acyl carrier protein [Nocardiopsis sp. NPDC058789]|uniref:Acyl carrier protein n=1 Tax=Nocardiopsis eucommiae TaxID=2831970 RepID=A0A975LBB3_9ACTN|nr:acyl carrier protein [Nocardiopsis eucommiae]